MNLIRKCAINTGNRICAVPCVGFIFQQENNFQFSILHFQLFFEFVHGHRLYILGNGRYVAVGAHTLCVFGLGLG